VTRGRLRTRPQRSSLERRSKLRWFTSFTRMFTFNLSLWPEEDCARVYKGQPRTPVEVEMVYFFHPDVPFQSLPVTRGRLRTRLQRPSLERRSKLRRLTASTRMFLFNLSLWPEEDCARVYKGHPSNAGRKSRRLTALIRMFLFNLLSLRERIKVRVPGEDASVRFGP